MVKGRRSTVSAKPAPVDGQACSRLVSFTSICETCETTQGVVRASRADRTGHRRLKAVPSIVVRDATLDGYNPTSRRRRRGIDTPPVRRPTRRLRVERPCLTSQEEFAR